MGWEQPNPTQPNPTQPLIKKPAATHQWHMGSRKSSFSETACKLQDKQEKFRKPKNGERKLTCKKNRRKGKTWNKGTHSGEWRGLLDVWRWNQNNRRREGRQQSKNRQHNNVKISLYLSRNSLNDDMNSDLEYNLYRNWIGGKPTKHVLRAHCFAG